MAESESPAATDGPGKLLERARTRAGLTRLQVADRLRLEPQIIEALENEQFERVGAAVYIRGHLRRYGELVGEDVGTIERLYMQRYRTAASPDVSRIVSEPLPAAPSTPRLGLRSAGAVAGLLVLAGLVWWAMRTAPPLPEPQPSVVAVPEPAKEPAPPAVADTRAPPPAREAPASPPAVAPSAPGAASAPRSARVRMTLSFLGDSATEVYDASGRRLYADTGRAGTVQTLQGQAPLRIVLGNAAGVVVDVNGRRVRLPAASEPIDVSLDASGQIQSGVP